MEKVSQTLKNIKDLMKHLALKNPLEEVHAFISIKYIYIFMALNRLLFKVSEARRQHVSLLVLPQNS